MWRVDSIQSVVINGSIKCEIAMGTIREYYDDVIDRAKKDIDSKDEAYLLGVKANELVQYYVGSYRLTTIERDDNREIRIAKDKAVPRRARFDSRAIVGRDIPLTIIYPIISDPKNLEVIRRRASKYWPSGFKLYSTHDSLQVTVSVNKDGVNQDTKITGAIEDIEKVIGWKNKDVHEGNERLETELSKYIRQKQEQLSADDDLIEEIIAKVPIKLQRRSTTIPMVDLTIREEIKPVYPSAEKKEEPYIEVDKVNAVLKLLKNGGLSFETTPKVYSKKLEEEDLRDILLSHLNIVFEGAATGETFVKNGKTDIHLRIEKRSILRAECKFWKGEERYLSMMEQLFGYLTWRQNYGILITFSRNKNFTSVIDKARTAALNAPTTVNNSLEVIDESHFVTINRLPGDTMKEVTLHHLMFNLYLEK